MNDILRTSKLVFKNFLRYPDICIPASKTTFLMGPSGCGKSTLFRLFNGIVSPESGEIFLAQENIAEIDTITLRRRVLLVSQQVFLFSGTIEFNFHEFYRFRDMQTLTRDAMKSYLSLCQGEFNLETECDTMSGGERQRVYIAICLSLMPHVLLLDEPTSALDSSVAFELVGSIKEFCMAHEMTLVMVSHDSSLVERYADYIVTLEGSAGP